MEWMVTEFGGPRQQVAAEQSLRESLEISGALDARMADREMDEADRRFLEQAIDLWINPEIKRRGEAGTLPESFVFHGAQVIFNIGDGAPQVRLNDGVRAVAQVRTTRAIAKGELVTDADIESIDAIELTEDDANAGHITLLGHAGQWTVAFDFRYNAAHVRSHADAAQQFLDCAVLALQHGKLRPFAENIFAATELLAKSLLLMHDESMLSSKKHEHVRGRYNRWGHLGNTDPRFVKLLNDVTELRQSARYLHRDMLLTEEDGEQMLGIAHEMLRELQRRIPKRHEVSSEAS